MRRPTRARRAPPSGSLRREQLPACYTHDSGPLGDEVRQSLLEDLQRRTANGGSAMGQFDQTGGKRPRTTPPTSSFGYCRCAPPLVPPGFEQWDDTRRSSWPGGPNARHLVAIMGWAGAPRAARLIVEVKAEPDSKALLQVGVYDCSWPGRWADGVQVGSVLLHLTGAPQRTGTASGRARRGLGALRRPRDYQSVRAGCSPDFAADRDGRFGAVRAALAGFAPGRGRNPDSSRTGSASSRWATRKAGAL